jgi:hypothetical protein
MKSDGSSFSSGTMAFGVAAPGLLAFGLMAAASLLPGPLPDRAIAAQAETQSTAPPPATKPVNTPALDAWRKSMAQIPRPKKGCFKATYPNPNWQEVPCDTAPQRPYQMPGAVPVVGNGNDVVAYAGRRVSSATGSFDSITNVNGEIGETGNLIGGPDCRGSIVVNVPSTFSLQLNTNTFATPSCSHGGAKCEGWQQFLYTNSGPISGNPSPVGSLYIQYWLGLYDNTCPAGWTTSTNGSKINCWKNSALATPVPGLTIQELSQSTVQLTAQAVSGGDDTAILAVGTTMYTTPTPMPDSVLSLAKGWRGAEFNIFGDGCSTQASFNDGTKIVVKIVLDSGSTRALSCRDNPHTTETNNLYFASPATPRPGPAIVFTESTDGAIASPCASGTSVGDTHLTTFGGVYYDFQAYGDFVLAEVDPDFVVQTRQVSAAPSYPYAAFNTAVGTRMGTTRVAVCVAPTRLMVDGKRNDLDDGKSLSLAGGVAVSRQGDVYSIAGQNGDIVRATVNNNGANAWINVSVGIGRAPTEVRGLLGNGDSYAIEARGGTPLRDRVSFQEFYRSYASSWRVAPKDSLLCDDTKVESGVPAKPFYASDLEQRERERTHAICTAAGITDDALLDACTLDVAVLGDETAAKVFTRTLIPRAVMRRPAL